VIFRLEGERPGGEQPRQLARLFVVARPLERLAALFQLPLVLLVGVGDAPRAQRLQRALRALAAVDACGSEEHDRVLNFLLFEAAQRLEVLRQDPDRTRFGTLEKLTVQVRHRLLRHKAQCTIRML
jgi:hypothetical protein